MSALVFRPFFALAFQPPGRRRTAAEVAPVAADPPLDPGAARRFRETMLPHLDAAYGFARYLTRDPTAAEDLVQEGYLQAYRAFRGFRGGDPKAWLFAILRSAFLMQARRRRPWDDLGAAELAEQIADPADDPEVVLLRAADDAALRTAIEALPEPFREALVLRELQEMSYRDISEITAAPIGTVMSRLARARRQLAAALGVGA
jgi:RNA polymerase sigma-70 factor (ECF subfamily)